jgi:hypothetical protein
MVAVRPKVGFGPDGSASAGNYEWLFANKLDYLLECGYVNLVQDFGVRKSFTVLTR